MKKNWLILSIMFVLLLVLGACNSDSTDSDADVDKDKDNETETETTDNNTDTSTDGAAGSLSMDVVHDGNAIDGGTLQVALVASSPFQGILLAELYEDGYDADVMSFASNSIFDVDGNFMIKDTGIAKLDVDGDNNKVTVTIQGDYKWSDGTPLTADDLIYPYEIIGHPKYTGIRYDGDIQNIVGMTEYHDGAAQTISGITKVDEKTIEIQFKKLSPAINFGGDGLWTYAAPKHQLSSIPVENLLQSDAVRKNPVVLGAFVYENMVNGESVQYVANEHYFKGKPKIEKVVLQVVPPTSIAEAMKAGQYDLALSYPANQYDGIKDLQNISVLGRPELAYSYLGFKLGKYDTAQGISIMNEDAKMNDPELRKAIAYAMDIEGVADKFYQGLRSRATSLIPPVFTKFFDANAEGYFFDAEKAKGILEAAGYKDVDGDGIREDKNGEKFSINLAGMSGSDTDEAIAEYYRQNWKDVGLDVQLTTGRLIEFNAFYDKVEADDPEIDMYMAAWGTGTNPSPNGLYGKEAAFNYSRYVSDDLTAILTAIDSQEAIDEKFRSGKFKEFNEYMYNTAHIIPMYFRTELIPVNKRVKEYNASYETPTELQELELVADAPVK